MKNLNKSQEQINRALGQLLKKSDRSIGKLYANTLNEIRRELAKIYEKWEVNGKLTYEEMSRYNRLTKFIKEIDHLLRVNYKTLRRVIYDVLGESYLDGYYLTAWAVETDTLSKLAYAPVRPETLTAMIENPISGLTLPQRLEKNRIQIIYKIQEEITQGLYKGETYGTMAKRLKGTLEGDAAKAMRVVRTESHRVVESAKLDSMTHAKKHGVVSVKTWRSSKDKAVRDAHADLDGKTIPVDEDFKSKNGGKGPAPGQMGTAKDDVNCRCRLSYSVQRIEKTDAKELENMTFERWKKERLKK